MSVSVNLLSAKAGEIKRFLASFYGKDVDLEDDVGHWAYVYYRPLESVDMISAVIDNHDKYQIALCIQINRGDFCQVTYDNLNDVIKGIYCLFYDENVTYCVK